MGNGRQSSGPSIPSPDLGKAVLAVVRPVGVVAAVVVALAWAGGSPVGAVAPVAHPAGADFDRLLVAACTLAAWICVSWFAIVVLIEAVTLAPGVAGRIGARVASRVAPAAVRRIAQALIGLTVLAGPLATAPAMATTPPSPSVAATSGPAVAAASAAALPPPTAFSLDRPAFAGRAPALASASVPGPGLDLDRPIAPFVPVRPAAPVPVTPTGPATLLSGVPHRDNSAAPEEAYVVRRGDALWDVAARHLGPQASAADVAREWPRWYAANRSVIGPDPGLILPGERLFPPHD